MIFDGCFSFLSGTIPERILDRCENVQGITMEGNVCAVTYQLINYLMELYGMIMFEINHILFQFKDWSEEDKDLKNIHCPCSRFSDKQECCYKLFNLGTIKCISVDS